ncbi:MAG TPA: hypothetical protein VJZ91_05080 [Blastocatellia bacterium]|nr:hypothetical protein [Blastocatellia bacterium]
MIKQRFFTQFACLLTVLLCSFTAAQAQQNTLGVAPASVEAKVKRGSTYTQTYTLFNNSPERLRFRCSLIDYWYDENNKRLTGRPGTLPRSASSWVQFSPAEVIVEPHSSAKVLAAITVPLAANGGYYTMPVFEAMPVKSEAESGNTATASIGIRFRGLVMLATEDASEYVVEVMGGKVLPPTASTPLEMNIDVRNRGTVHARVRGVFAVLDENGRLAGRGKIEAGKFLPGQRNMMKVPWAGELPVGRYTAVVTLSYDRVGMEPATLIYEVPFEVGQQHGIVQGR